MSTNKVVITEAVNQQLLCTLQELKFTKLAVLVDENTLINCYPLIKESLPDHCIIEIKSGEKFKTIETCNHIWGRLTDEAFDRKSLMLNLGGGVIGDMGGFAARTFKRGIKFINIPTTLLAQVDASIGGKLGIDFEGLKNHIGLFSDPDKVIIDPIFLESLPHEELISGFAEVIKHNLIADESHWEELKTQKLSDLNWLDVIKHSVAIKSRVVASDPFETGNRKTLNFGHTIGHAVESFKMIINKRILHGEAVALGMISESYLSYKKGLLSSKELKSIENYIDSVFTRIKIEPKEINKILDLMGQDKKNRGNRILAALLEKIGSAKWDVELTRDEVRSSLLYYSSYT
ncbi:MAG: 3-dehydroquinate synthase [Bacteroidota bacterium]